MSDEGEHGREPARSPSVREHLNPTEVGGGAKQSNHDDSSMNTRRFRIRWYPRRGDTCGDRHGEYLAVKDTVRFLKGHAN